MASAATEAAVKACKDCNGKGCQTCVPENERCTGCQGKGFFKDQSTASGYAICPSCGGRARR